MPIAMPEPQALPEAAAVRLAGQAGTGTLGVTFVKTAGRASILVQRVHRQILNAPLVPLARRAVQLLRAVALPAWRVQVHPAQDM